MNIMSPGRGHFLIEIDSEEELQVLLDGLNVIDSHLNEEEVFESLKPEYRKGLHFVFKIQNELRQVQREYLKKG